MAANEDTKQLTVVIAGRPYSLKILAKDESILRRIVKEVNERINKFQITYPNRDRQDCMAMSLLAFAVDLQKAKQNPASSLDEFALTERLQQVDKLLDALLDS